MSRRYSPETRKNESAPAPVQKQTGKRGAHDQTAAPAGNSALRDLLSGTDAGKPLPTDLRIRMEQAFGASFESVRVREDATANEEAAALHAEAFAAGDQIVLAAEAPPEGAPGREELLAHELAHVLQQRSASEVCYGEVSHSGDAFEQHANEAAGQALTAASVRTSPPGGSPAGVQRQQRQSGGATRDEVQQAMQQFLERARQAQPDTDLRHSEHVRSVLDAVVRGAGPLVFVNVQDILSHAPNDPAEIARRIARGLPASMSRQVLNVLGQARAAGPTPSLPQRVADLAARTAPGERETPPGMFGESQEDRMEREAQLMRSLTQTPEPQTFGPYSVDLLRLGRIAQGLPQAIRPPSPGRQQPASRSYPEVETAIQSIPADALTPAEARGTGRAGEFADAQEFARDVARQIDTAQQAGQDTVTIRLGANYNQVRDRPAMRTAVEDIISRIRAALPHHGSAVTYVDVFFGGNLVTRGIRRSQ